MNVELHCCFQVPPQSAEKCQHITSGVHRPVQIRCPGRRFLNDLVRLETSLVGKRYMSSSAGGVDHLQGESTYGGDVVLGYPFPLP